MPSKPSPTPAQAARKLGPPMLSRVLDVVPDDPQFLASCKFDGWRARASIGESSVELTSRQGHPITSVSYIADAVRAVARPGTILDGELVDRARPRQRKRTTSILGSPEPHTPTCEDPPVTFAVFDILFIAGTDVRDEPLHERLGLLAALFATADAEPHTRALIDRRPEPALLLVEHRPSSSAWARELVDAGEEGVMIKHRDSLYRHGARDAGWWKFKPQAAVSAVCTGFSAGNGAPGSVRSITFRLPSSAEGHASSGISDLESGHMARHPEEYIGREIALAHHGEEHSGLLRHPVYRGVIDPSQTATSSGTVRAPRELPGEKELAAAVAGGGGKRRNYAAMGDSKLVRCIVQLRAREGDAFDRCVERGSGDPAGDLSAALLEAGKRGLSA
jgi:bifunctional non-homologous end joining protein LigD